MSYYVWGDESDEELELESSGDICLLQRYRYSTFANRDTLPSYPTDLKGLLQTEVALRENTQREIALKEKIEELAKEDTYATVVQDLQGELSTLSKEYWTLERRLRIATVRWLEVSISGVHSQNGICIEYLWKIALGEEAVVVETVDAVLIASQNGNLQLVIAPWSVLVAREPGGLHSTLSRNPNSARPSNLIATVHVRGITIE
ncbi:hypothetical protein N7516_009517 [Penicillium verrucosum]|uniref:uncharacterized protein n=1 Tax=Penicillium verrucosum TaxID=60171 RepID=UPI002544DFF7|nr:uncharacterized protein N7516_009517 [Penicillium verrucosum]KAJ5921814.1 hypothetical protein N7516_009517 [Penicillium verrucosum]